ncbi:MAG: uroporphyrinogen decarboxylase [Aestuariivirgaceae bacterium]|nr:uroporphyrinogen decarboxylase [Aestuariivirgaceae bacterium]
MTVKGKALMDVLEGRIPARRPIWMMRQAGRYLPEYRQLRAEAGSFLQLCYDPVRACEVTVQPLRRFDLDAAILFADILLLPQALGCDLTFRENEGPHLSTIRDEAAVGGLDGKNYLEKLAPVFETVARVKKEIPDHVSLIGFCGAPWTVASYMIEGGGSDERILSRTAAYRNEAWFRLLMDQLVNASIAYLAAQVRAGADAVQIFDSWAGDLSASQWDDLVITPMRRIVEGLRREVGPVPVIGFARGLGAGQIRVATQTGVNAVGCEQAVPASWMAKELVPHCVVQGNLDPLALVLGGDILKRQVRALTSALPAHAHIFNLGHGVRQETPPEHVGELVAAVRGADLG